MFQPNMFSRDKSYLVSDYGRVPLFDRGDGSNGQAEAVDKTSEMVRYNGYWISRDGEWIMWNGENVLLLPPDFTAKVPRVPPSTDIVAVVCGSGRFFTIGFPAAGPP